MKLNNFDFDFEMFKTILQGKSNPRLRLYFTTFAKVNCISETVTPGNSTKANKQKRKLLWADNLSNCSKKSQKINEASHDFEMF